MARKKKSEKKMLKALIAIIIVIIASIFGINISEIDLSDTNSVLTSILGQEYTNEEETYKTAEGKLILTMIDVGQADSFLFVQNDKVALVDCGTRETGENVVKHLKKLGIEKIDYLFGTHPHDDHMGGMYDIITNFEVSKIILPKVKTGEVTTNWYLKLMKEIKNGEYEVENPEVGTIYNIGNAEMKVIGPISQPEDNLNNYSTVLKVSFGKIDVIMTGDAETSVEKEILESGENIDAEILKVGHHGSNTSNSKKFLDKVSPDYALISAELGNSYEHPTKNVMERLEERDIEVYRTDENGTVVATITSDSVSFSCEPGDYLSGAELAERK